MNREFQSRDVKLAHSIPDRPKTSASRPFELLHDFDSPFQRSGIGAVWDIGKNLISQNYKNLKNIQLC
jgi:hypothetical protein